MAKQTTKGATAPIYTLETESGVTMKTYGEEIAPGVVMACTVCEDAKGEVLTTETSVLSMSVRDGKLISVHEARNIDLEAAEAAEAKKYKK